MQSECRGVFTGGWGTEATCVNESIEEDRLKYTVPLNQRPIDTAVEFNGMGQTTTNQLAFHNASENEVAHCQHA